MFILASSSPLNNCNQSDKKEGQHFDLVNALLLCTVLPNLLENVLMGVWDSMISIILQVLL